MSVKEWIKKNKYIYRILLNIYMFGRKVMAIPEYLSADSVHVVWNKKKNKKCYLILEWSGKSGLMTQLIIVIGWLKYAEDNNYTLIVDMTSGDNMYRTENENAWEKFFIQPMCGFSVSKEELLRIKVEENYSICPQKLRHNYQFEPLYSLAYSLFKPKITFPLPRDYFNRMVLHREYQRLYREYIKFTPEVKKYMKDEYNSILRNRERVLGVLARGTDYVQSKPYNHPIQPEVEDIILKCKEISDQWDYIYLATEEFAIEQKFRNVFGNKVLINSRQYYDGNYETKWLCDTHIDRENDEFLRGLEYVSSINLLSKCNALVAGLCGGTQAALIMNGGRYVFVHLFDLGNY